MNYELTVTNEILTLIQAIKEEIGKGKQRIEHTIDNEKTTTYWNIGKQLHEHLLDYNERIEYEESLYKLIAKELTIGISTVYRAVQFYETYPEIFAPGRKLTWSHYRILITVKDEDKRKEFEQLVITNDIGKRELQDLVKEYRKDKNHEKKSILLEKRGIPYSYKLKPITEDEKTHFYIDLGFRMYLNKLDNKTYDENDIIQIKEDKNKSIIIKKNDRGLQELYTYKGYVNEIIDGDTLWVTIDLGFDARTSQKIRLRGINAAKIETETGQKARKYIEKRLTPCPFIIVKTYYRDKYNRYLADIFYDKNEVDTTKVAENGVYLNWELLDKGFVKKY
ncbi:MAG: thermonuclease family protein [Spirochaetales bacterium]|nr:thermonuclease family protein [Spirochaetales bacterium]